MDKFASFLRSIKNGVDDILVESINSAYHLIYESEVGGNIGILNAKKISTSNPFSSEKTIELVFVDGSIYPIDTYEAHKLYQYIQDETEDLLESPYYLEDMLYKSADNFKKWLSYIGFTG